MSGLLRGRQRQVKAFISAPGQGDGDLMRSYLHSACATVWNVGHFGPSVCTHNGVHTQYVPIWPQVQPAYERTHCSFQYARRSAAIISSLIMMFAFGHRRAEAFASITTRRSPPLSPPPRYANSGIQGMSSFLSMI